MEQQTAVEWLAEICGLQDLEGVIAKAKEMEKEQIIDAFIFSKREHYTLGECWPTQTVVNKAEKYYNKTFENQ